MAFHHHQNHHTTTATCCCHPPSPPSCYYLPPSPPPLTTDPFHVASIVTHLLQTETQSPQNLIKPTPINLSQNHQCHTQSQQHHQYQQKNTFLLSLQQRIDALETSIQKYSNSGFSLRDAAARIIQTHFRGFLVHRSRTLRQLKELGSIKSGLSSLKSSLSRNSFFDFDSLSHHALDLLLKLDSIQSGDKMIRDSKRAVTREIVEFLELVDGMCVKRQRVLTRKIKTMTLVRNDSRVDRDTRGFTEHNAGLKARNVDREEKKLMSNLRERVEKLGRMSKALEEQEQEVFGDAEIKGLNHVDDEEEDDEDILDQIASNYRLKNGLNAKKNGQSSNAKKCVGFMEDGNLIRLYNTDGDSRSTSSRLVDVIEDSTKGSLDEEETQSDGERCSESSEEMRKSKSDDVSEECDYQEEDFTFSTTMGPAKMDPRANTSSRKPAVKIVG